MMPLVSILIPVFKCEAWVANAFESAFAQTWPNKEVIVLDDGSTDGTLDVLRRFDGEIKLKSCRRGGRNVARNIRRWRMAHERLEKWKGNLPI
jgi:glycosyltransferase involved in cell wall biosynthesis